MPRFFYATVAPSLPFAGFTLWLLAFPLAGPLQTGAGPPDLLLYFLVPHIFCLLGLILVPPDRLAALTTGGVLLALAAVLLYRAAPHLAVTTMIMAGTGGAALAVRAGVQLHKAGNPVAAAAIGLVLANLLLAGLALFPSGQPWPVLIVAGGLVWPLTTRLPKVPRGDLAPLTRVLPFIFLFHLIAGVLYGFVLPFYQQSAWLPGLELAFYGLAVLAGVALFSYRPEAALLGGMVLALLACLFLYPLTPGGANRGMWAMQAAAGFVDLFVVAFLVRCVNPAQTFAAGCATICSGILTGYLLTTRLTVDPNQVVFAASLMLNAAALSLLLLFRRTDDSTPEQPDNDLLPKALEAQLSARERQVLLLVMDGARYRDVAIRMEISESSVKTYMNRIFDKTRTTGKKQLLQQLAATATADGRRS